MQNGKYDMMEKINMGCVFVLAKQCEKCGEKISFAVFMKQKNFNKLTCPYCEAHLRPTGKSKLFFTIFCIVPLIALPNIFQRSLIPLVIWILCCIFVVQPIIYQYEINQSDEQL